LGDADLFGSRLASALRLRGGPVRIPKSVEVLDQTTVSDYVKGRAQVCVIAFESVSRLRRIEKSCFNLLSLRSLCIPKDVALIDGSAFAGCSIGAILVNPGNCRFLIDGDFLVDCVDSIAVHHFGGRDDAVIRGEIKGLGKCCLAGCRDPVALGTVTFQRLREQVAIGESCFEKVVLDSICIPRSVESLGKKCFVDVKIDRLSFDSQWGLRRLDEGCFNRASAKSVCVRESVESITKLCFSGSRMEKLTFEQESILTRVGEWCFQECIIEAIWFPNSIQSFS
jgi:hypothetical protein